MNGSAADVLIDWKKGSADGSESASSEEKETITAAAAFAGRGPSGDHGARSTAGDDDEEEEDDVEEEEEEEEEESEGDSEDEDYEDVEGTPHGSTNSEDAGLFSSGGGSSSSIKKRKIIEEAQTPFPVHNPPPAAAAALAVSTPAPAHQHQPKRPRTQSHQPRPTPPPELAVEAEGEESLPLGASGKEIDNREVRLIRQLGRGQYGTVFEGECRAKRVAVKVFEGQRRFDRKKWEAYLDEIQIMAANTHPNIALIMGACTTSKDCKIVIELLDGDLETLLLHSEEGKRLNLYQRLLMAKDAALGLNWLHKSVPAIIHSDLKLENLMYKRTEGSYLIKVADFGFSLKLDTARGDQSSLLSSFKGGTPHTLAPEIMLRQPFNQRADVYSFGMVLWGIYTCKQLYPHHHDIATFTRAIVGGERPPIPDDCLPSLRELMQDCWQGDPERRPGFDEINERLDVILVHAAISDRHGQFFWIRYFLKEHTVPWDTFIGAFCAYLKVPLPAQTEEGQLKLQCMKALFALGDIEGRVDVNIKKFGDVLDWFGPMVPEGQQHGYTILDTIKERLEKEWFHGDVSREEAQRRLHDKEQGAFLVRFNSNIPGAFTLDKLTPQRTIVSARIIQHKKGGFYPENDPKSSFPDLTTFVDELWERMGLTVPCPGSRFQSLFTDQPKNVGYGTSFVTFMPQ